MVVTIVVIVGIIGIGVGILAYRNRTEKGIESGITSFRRELHALAPRPGDERSAPHRPPADARGVTIMSDPEPLDDEAAADATDDTPAESDTDEDAAAADTDAADGIDEQAADDVTDVEPADEAAADEDAAVDADDDDAPVGVAGAADVDPTDSDERPDA